MIEPNALARCLWKPFLADISRGGPVYFTFSAELVRELLSQEGHEASDPISEVCDAARRLYFVAGSEATLHEDALDVTESGRSLAIILVCQQVLAVEAMVRDPHAHGFSENAYFPRLRQLMSPLLEIVSTNPFHFAEFEAIWRAFARDIRSVPGHSDASITFRFGVETGVNKARAFPLSQALLTLEDLKVIAQRGKRLLENVSPTDAWRILRQLRYHLSRRAQRLIALGVFRERVVDQVMNYLKVAEPERMHRAAERGVQLNQEDIIIFRDTSDWFEVVYRAYLRAPGSPRDNDEARIQAELIKRVASDSFLLFVLTELGDSWVCSSRTMTIEPGESFLVVGEPACMADVDQWLRRYGIESSQVEGPDGSGGGLGHYAVTQRTLSRTSREIALRNGRASSVDTGSYPAAYHWTGGLAVDARGSKFVREYLPTHIDFKGAIVPFDELETVNGRYTSAEAFVSSLAHATDDSSFEVGFPGGRTARLSVAVSRYPGEPRIGYPVDADGVLDVGLVTAGADDFVVSGFSENSREYERGFDIRSCALLLKALRARNGHQLPPTSVEVIRLRVRASKIPDTVRCVMLRLLGDDARLPSRLCAELGLNVD